jgi:hypothetical protein
MDRQSKNSNNHAAMNNEQDLIRAGIIPPGVAAYHNANLYMNPDYGHPSAQSLYSRQMLMMNHQLNGMNGMNGYDHHPQLNGNGRSLVHHPQAFLDQSHFVTNPPVIPYGSSKHHDPMDPSSALRSVSASAVAAANLNLMTQAHAGSVVPTTSIPQAALMPQQQLPVEPNVPEEKKNKVVAPSEDSKPKSSSPNNNTSSDHKKTATGRDSYHVIFQRRYEELVEYKAKHGHVCVPRKSGPLGEWVRNQRRYYRSKVIGERSPLTQERIDLLNSIGFIWLPSYQGGRRFRVDEDSDDSSIDSISQESSQGKKKRKSSDANGENTLSKKAAKPNPGETPGEDKCLYKYPSVRLKQVHTLYDKLTMKHKGVIQSITENEIKLEQIKRRLESDYKKRTELEASIQSTSKDILKFELEDDPDEEWNRMYVKLTEYKERNGHVLFPRSFLPATSIVEGEVVVDVDANILAKGTEDKNKNDSKPSSKDEAKELQDNDEESASNYDDDDVSSLSTSNNLNTEMSKQAVVDKMKKVEEFGNFQDYELIKWVGKMRKFPKKQFKAWKRLALDELGFVWHQYDATWTDKYNELRAYKAKHGHTQIPSSYGNLGVWVGTQRKQYRLMQQGRCTHMTPERVKLLEQLGFLWQVNTWMERYLELCAFYERYQHFNIPSSYPNKQLRPWVTTQRSHYRFLQEGKPSQLTAERIQLLEKIEFPWKTREDWQTRYEEFQKFVQEYRTCAVPRSYEKYPKLYRWVNCQRMEYQKYKNGEHSRLKEDQIRLLDYLNFE